MLAAFRAFALSWRIIGVVGLLVTILGAVAGLYAYVDHQGYARATLEWTLKYQQLVDDIDKRTTAEINRQQAANDAAKAEEDAQLEAERKRQMAAVDRAMTLAAEAAADPNAANVALDAAAVDRHNRRID